MSATITEPGLYTLPETAYHADLSLTPTLGRSLSVSGAKTLLTDPARFLYERENGRPPKDVFDEGTLAHELILRGGDDRIRIIDAYDWRSKAAQEAKKAAHEQRLVPAHRGTLLMASKVARAVRTNPLETISHAVASNAGSVGRQAAVIAAASGLVLTLGVPAQATPAVREAAAAPVDSLAAERAPQGRSATVMTMVLRTAEP